MTHAILTHGGAASPSSNSDGCEAAAQAAEAVLRSGGDAMAAALAATVVLEDDPRFNAGTGSNLRLDGRVIEMDASIMTSDGRFGAVAAIQRVKNPILVAAKVRDTPHLMLAGDGATAFARRLGFPDHDPTTEGARRKYERAVAELRGRGDGHHAGDAARWKEIAIDQVWNFGGEPWAGDASPAGRRPGGEGCDTVGAVVRDARGRFAATASTGGTLYMLRGRVGDSPLMGCGVYAGPKGAVAATGIGEEIVRRFLSRTVYEWLADGMPADLAAARAVALYPEAVDIGLLVVSETDHAVAANRDMASSVRVG